MFGKHPVRADHWQVGSVRGDAGRVRGILYGGIERNVREGRWESLGPDLRLAGFGHDVIGRVGRTAVACRISASVDRTGTRSSFPLVSCVAAPWRPDLTSLLGIASALDEAIRAASDEASIGGAVALADAALDDLDVERPSAQGESVVSIERLVGELATLVDDAAQPDAVLRTAWALCRRFSPVLAVAIPEGCADESVTMPQTVRVESRRADSPSFSGARSTVTPSPAGGPGAAAEPGHAPGDRPTAAPEPGPARTDSPVPMSAQVTEPVASPHVAWARFLDAILEPRTDFWVFGTPSPRWLDIVVGTPSADELFLLVVTPAHSSTIGSVPLRGISESFRSMVDRVLAGSGDLRPTAAEVTTLAAPVGDALAEATSDRAPGDASDEDPADRAAERPEDRPPA